MVDQYLLNFIEIKTPFNSSKIDQAKITQLISIKPYEAKLYLDDEMDYIDEYDKKLSPQKLQKNEEAKQRRDRLYNVQSQVIRKQEEMKKNEMNQRDIDYIKKLQAEERSALEREKKEKEESEKKEYQILQITSQFPSYDYDAAKQILISNNWSIDLVLQRLYSQQNQSKQEQDKKENMIIQLMSEFQNIEYDYGYQLLQRQNWNIEAARQELKGFFKIKVNIVLLNQQGGIIKTLSSDFDNNGAGWDIITYLNQIEDPKGQYYWLYRDPQCTRLLNYELLTQPMKTLDILSNSSIYAKLAVNPPI